MIFRRMTFFLLLIGLSILSIGLFTSQAATSTLSWNITCNGFSSNGGTINLDRDNTGNGEERFVLTAIDGEGDVIFDPIVDDAPVGTSLYVDPSVSYRWTRRPVSNPITVTMVSTAGLGLPEQVLFLGVAECADLPLSSSLLPNPTATPYPSFSPQSVSPSVGLNASPPKQSNPRDIFENEAGTLYVDRVSANLRSGDGVQYTVVGVVDGGTRLLVRGVNRDRTWWLVQSGDLRGWISNALVIVSGNLTDVPIVEAEGIIQVPTFYVYSDTYIRVSPRPRSIAVCFIEGDLEYEIAGRNNNASWFGIVANCSGEEVVGWIQAEAGAVRNPGNLPIPVIP